MLPLERQDKVLGLLREEPGLRVGELAGRLGVSEGTIRNDLRALESQGKVHRVHGGAVLQGPREILSPTFAARMRLNPSAKQNIARWAADLIDDGDSILLDASTTVYALVPFLQKRQNLTIITNGIEVALALAKNLSHTVILIGGKVRPDGTSVGGRLGEQMLQNLHARLAFVSCSGFSLQAGLTEVDLPEVELKRAMIQSAERVIALIDSSKFGKVDLTSFAGVQQISHIFTDDKLAPHFIEELKTANLLLTLCSADSATTLSTADNGHTRRYKIGFANLSEQIPFAREVRRSLERAVNAVGHVDLVIADNKLDNHTALQVADYLIQEGVDLVIEYHLDEKSNAVLMDKFQRAGIPVIAVDAPIVGATFFGMDNYRAGRIAGLSLAQWIQAHWDGQLDYLVLLEALNPGILPQTRIQSQIDSLRSVLGDIAPDRVLTIPCDTSRDACTRQFSKFLLSHPDSHHIAVIAEGDDVALSALAAARQLNREGDLAIVSQGAGRPWREEIRRPNSPVIGTLAHRPERYGPKLLQLALHILEGQPVPPAIFNEHIFLTRDNIDQYYPDEREGIAREISEI